MILSLLIPVLPKRYAIFMKLLHELQRQVTYMHTTHPTLGLIEILFDDAPSFLDGGKSIGGKRNELRQKAIGKYLAFCDDDDEVAPNYIETLIGLCNEDKDVCTFRCIYKSDYYWSVLNMSLKNETNEEASPDRIIERTPWHVCAIRNTIAQKEHFDDANNSWEDWEWMEKILKHCKTEAHTDKILTQYNHSEKNSESDKIFRSK